MKTMTTLSDALSHQHYTRTGETTPPPAPACPKCGGYGWIGYDVDIHDPRFGKTYMCDCIKPRYYARGSGLTEKELTLDWGAIRDMNNATEAVRAVRETLDRGCGWVYLWGQYGAAKSLILQIAVAEAIRQVREAAYVRMVEIIDNLRASFEGKSSGEEERRLERWASVPLLAIDEFDRLRDSEYASERRFLLMDRRYQDAIRGNTITLMASNSDPKTYDGYLSSRIFDGRFAVVKLEGIDARPYMGWK